MNITDLNVGVIGQIQGPLAANSVINFDENVKLKIGIFIEEKDLMLFNFAFPVMINNDEIIIGKAGMYEVNEAIPISSLTFVQGAPASVRIDYTILSDT